MLHPLIDSWKVVVTDSLSVKTLSAACKMYDILEENVTRMIPKYFLSFNFFSR